MSDYCQAHDHGEEKEKEEDGHDHASATASDAFLGTFGEPLFPFAAVREQQADDAPHQGADQDEFQHSEQN